MDGGDAQTGLDAAIAEALKSGTDEITRLSALAERTIDRYGVSAFRSDATTDLESEFEKARDDFARNLRDHLAEQCEVLATFNIAFFGRTGAGKSTLLSAFGQLDGKGVSPGDSDWTTTVESVTWRGCRLFDTPGINGWGGRKSRAELEAVARRAVEIADVVLLCFDSQSQQASEFSKVADWVKHYGKPTVAVLNVRNLRWRHPSKVPNESARQNISEPVRQHSDNIKTELTAIGLADTPIVAIHSRRALFARASTPFRGPAERDFINEREQFGIDYLAKWSNFGILEALLSSAVEFGGAEMRLTALRQGARAILSDEADRLDTLVERLKERIEVADRGVARYLDVLGYLELDERPALLHDAQWSGDLLTIAENARGLPFLASADGTFRRHVRALLKTQLSVPRSAAMRRFKQLEHDAFEEGKDVDEETFVNAVFDESELQEALEQVWVDAAEFLERELSLATAEWRHSGVSAERDKSDLRGSAGSSAHVFETALKTSGLLTGGAGAVLGAVALTNAWNPAGWVAGVVLAGLGIGSQVISWFGNRQGGEVERQRAEARAKAAYAGRTAINSTFDRINSEFAHDARSVVWGQAVNNLRPLLQELVALRHLSDGVAATALAIREEALGVATPADTNPMGAAQADLVRLSSANDRARALNQVLLGEDWFNALDAATNHAADKNDEAFIECCRAHNENDQDRLTGVLAAAIARTSMGQIATWTRSLADAAKQDPIFVDALQAAIPRTNIPTIAVAGDYSAGKSSFIKRLIVEMDGTVSDSIDIHGAPATNEVRLYSLENFNILDTPGFQSGRTDHDQSALDGVGGAALVIVLLHVNLLIGDTTQLEGIIKGTDSAVGKWPRILFVINRCDELGVDPHNDVEDYYRRRDRKMDELHAALTSRGLAVDVRHTHGVAADPFSAIGGRLPVSRDDYGLNREWDGIEPLVQSLRSLAPVDITHANALAAVDDACSQLLRLASAGQAEVNALQVEIDKFDALLGAFDRCLGDANQLKAMTEQALGEKVSRHTTEAIRKTRLAQIDDVGALEKAALSWLNADLQADVEQFIGTVAADIDAWSSTHASALNRELAAAQFAHKVDLSAGEAPPTGDRMADAAHAAGFVTESAQKLVSAFGNRDAAYWVGKQAGVKFKPWGAVKAGQSVARVGVVLQVVSVGWDAFDWVRTNRKRSSWEDKLDQAVDQIETTSADRVREILYGEGGPLTFLDQRCSDVREMNNQHCSQQDERRARLADGEKRLAAATQLTQSFNNVREDVV